MPNSTIIISIILTIGSNTIAQLLLKKGSQIEGLLNFYFLGGLSFYGLSTIFYMWVLKHMSVTVAYPVTIGMTIVSITFFNTLLHRENLMISQLIGIFLIVFGIVSVTVFPQKI